MVKVEKSENQEFLEKSISHLEATGFENIKADMEGYETPKSYVRKAKGAETKITPDIVAVKNGRKYYFEISLKSEKPRLLKTKWLFLLMVLATWVQHEPTWADHFQKRTFFRKIIRRCTHQL